MEKFKRTFSVRRRKDPLPESSKPHQWQEDEKKVREGTCSFHVKYLGCVEVFESRGIQICEEAVKALKSRKSRSVWSRMSLRKKRGDNQTSKSGHHHAMLYVTGDALRVVDDVSKGLIVDQTIEKVSFCAPDRNYEKGFAYICRDGTTRRWMCHGFLAVKESGERLSHAVGCAFAVCLEKKQQREKEKVTVMFNENGTSFTRMGSFRPTTLTERLTDPQSAIVAEPVPVKKAENAFAVQRPHASVDLLERQGSFRGFEKLSDSSPFKRNLSLRLNELPSTLDRQRQGMGGIIGPHDSSFNGPVISTIMEAEETNESGLAHDLSAMHINMNNNGSSTSAATSSARPYQAGTFPAVAGNAGAVTAPSPMLSGENNNSIFSAQNQSARLLSYQQQQLQMQHQQQMHQLQMQQQMQQQQFLHQQALLGPQPGVLASAGGFTQQQLSMSTAAGGYGTVTMSYQQPQQQLNLFNGAGLPAIPPSSVSSNIPHNSAAPASNPWAAPAPPVVAASGISSLQQKSVRSEAESWLSATANFIDPFAGVPVTSQSNRSSSRGYTPVSAGPASPQPSASNQIGLSAAAVTVHAVPSPVPTGNAGQAGNIGNLAWQQPNASADQFDTIWAAKASTSSGAVVNPFQPSVSVSTNPVQAMHNGGTSVVVNQQPTFQFTI